MAPSASQAPLVVDRYALYGEIAAGGMATVHFGRLLGPSGFSRTVAVKRLHAHLAKDPDFVSMFLDEARLAARVRHPNVVPTLDVVSLGGELFLVMDYVQGESLSRLLRGAVADGVDVPLPILASIVCGMLHGLHAAHEATNERGEPLDLVHRDVSPQNVLVGVDGIARVLDFGVAKAIGRTHNTRDGSIKGKVPYMAPEQLRHQPVDRRSDVYAAGVVLWELLTGERLFQGSNEAEVITSVLETKVEKPSARVPGLPKVLDDVVMRALSRNPSERFDTARQMAREIERNVTLASPGQVGEWVEQIASDSLTDRARIVSAIETNTIAEEPTRIIEAPGSQVSSISVTRPASPPRRSRMFVAFLAGLVVAAMAAFGVRTCDREKAVEPAITAPSPHVEIAAPPPSPSADVVAPPPVTASASTPSKKILKPHFPPTAHPSSTPACVVKSYVDSAGVKHYFNDCPKK